MAASFWLEMEKNTHKWVPGSILFIGPQILWYFDKKREFQIPMQVAQSLDDKHDVNCK